MPGQGEITVQVRPHRFGHGQLLAFGLDGRSQLQVTSQQPQRLAAKRLGLRVVTFGVVQLCQIVETGGIVGMSLAKRGSENLQGATEQRFGAR